jgi:hypothetical protein
MKRNEISANCSEREGYEIVRISANDFQSAFSVRNRPVVHVLVCTWQSPATLQVVERNLLYRSEKAGVGGAFGYRGRQVKLVFKHD